MVQMHHERTTLKSEFIAEQRLCLGAVSQEQLLPFSLGRSASCFTLQTCAAGG